MEPMRWTRGLLPLAVMALVSAAPRPPVLGAVDPPWLPPPCTEATAAPPDGAAAPAWYRLDGILDRQGTLAGMRLVVGLGDEPARWIALPPESFATGPRRGVVLVGEDDGSRSRLALLDIVRGCRTTVAGEASVVRSALLDEATQTIWEHRVDRATREDLGIWRRPVDGAAAVRALGGAPADGRYGRTFATEIRIGADGRVAATSCGERACRTRLLDSGSGRVWTIGPTGPVIGLAEDGSVIANAQCPGYPCSILAHPDRGGARELVDTAGRAALAGNRLVFESGAGHVVSLDLRTGDRTSIEGADLVPVQDGSKAAAGADRATDEVLLAKGGRIDAARGLVLAPGVASPRSIAEGVR